MFKYNVWLLTQIGQSQFFFFIPFGKERVTVDKGKPSQGLMFCWLSNVEGKFGCVIVTQLETMTITYDKNLNSLSYDE